MKRGILVATVMITAAGVASANLVSTTPQRVASPVPQAQRVAEPPPIVAAPVATGSSATSGRTSQPNAAPAKVASVQTTQKSVVEVHQAPVPFKLKPRAPVNLPPVADNATGNKATDVKPADKPAEASTEPAADTFGENAARAAIEADGYRGVKVLRKGADGVWHASALRGKTTVMLTVDSSGSVTAD